MLRELARNTSLSLLLNISTRAANVILFVLIGRRLGASAAGTFQLALTYLLLFSVFTRGLDDHVVKRVASTPQEARRYLTSFVIVRLIINVILYIGLLVLVASVLEYPYMTSVIIAIMGACVISDSLIGVTNAVMLGLRKFMLPTGIALGVCILRLGLSILFMLFTSASIVAIAIVWLGSSVIGATLALILTERCLKHCSHWELFDSELVKHQLPLIWPFIINGFLMALEFQIDVILLSMLHGESEVGYYGASMTVVATVAMMSQAYRFAVYPLMAAFASKSREQLVVLYERSLLYLSSIAVPIVFGIVLLAPDIVTLVFSSAFSESVITLRILAIILFFTFVNVPNNRLMFVYERQRWTTWMTVGSLCINLMLNFLFTPHYGAQGAAVARVGSSLLFFVVNLTVISKFVLRREVQLLRLLWRPLLAAFLMACLVLYLDQINVILRSIIGAVFYMITFTAVGGIPDVDLKAVSNWLRRQGVVLHL
jgi:O-antigen/teichoic acid export membrane protein